MSPVMREIVCLRSELLYVEDIDLMAPLMEVWNLACFNVECAVKN